MIKASSLVYALFIITIVAIICSAFILANYYHNSYLISIAAKTKQLSYLKSGLSLMRSDYRANEFFSEKKQLFEEDSSSIVLIKRIPWGAFDLVNCESSWKKKQFKKNLLLGVQPSQHTALYLADQQNSLSLSGRTILKGDVYLPKAGVKRTFIEGTAFRGSKLVQGEVKESNLEIPPLNEHLLEALLSCRERNSDLFLEDSTETVQDVFAQLEINNSFNNRTLLVDAIDTLVLENIELSNNIIIRSLGTIVVKSSANLKHVLLFAKKIVFEKNVEGTLQAYATDTMLIGQKCRFDYPTVFGLIGKKDLGNQLMNIEEDAVVNGIIIQNRIEVATNDLSLLNINEKVIVQGEIYWNGKVLLKGVVEGSVYCNAFTLSTASSIYMNHLLDAEIDVTKRSSFFLSPLLTESSRLKRKETVIELP